MLNKRVQRVFFSSTHMCYKFCACWVYFIITPHFYCQIGVTTRLIQTAR